MDFLPNEKTIEYINTLAKNKLTSANYALEINKMGVVCEKIIALNKVIEFYEHYELNHKLYAFDRNVIAKIKALSVAVSYIEQDGENLSDEFIKMYKDLIQTAECVEMKYSILKKDSVKRPFFLRINELFMYCLKARQTDTQITKKYFDLVKSHIDQLEYMAYVIINYLDEARFDINDYSVEFFRAFLCIDIQDP